MLEPEGITVLVGIPNKKYTPNFIVIKKRAHNKTIQYGFVKYRKFQRKTARIYGDHLLLTADRGIMADINKVFNVLKKPKDDFIPILKTCKIY